MVFTKPSPSHITDQQLVQTRHGCMFCTNTVNQRMLVSIKYTQI